MATRYASEGRRGFIWIPRLDPLFSDIKIDSASVRNNVLSADFTKTIFPEVGEFKVTLINADGAYTNKYEQDDIVETFFDFTDGTTRRFKGKIKSLTHSAGDAGFTLNVSGTHLTGELKYVYITKEYAGTKTCQEIFQELVSDNLTGYTTANVASSTVSPTVKWEDTPFIDAIYELCKLAQTTSGNMFDAYLDDDLDFHFFERGSIQNTSEAIVWNNTLISTPDIGEQSLTTINKVQIVGDDGSGIPVLSTSGTGDKLKKIIDTDVTNVTQALEVASAERQAGSDTEKEGETEAFLLPTLQPGDVIYFSHPVFNIVELVRISKFTHHYPNETTTTTIGKERRIQQILKTRIDAEAANRTIKNPFNMENSINLKFDDYSELSSYDSNIIISNGKIKLSSGAQGVFTSNSTTATNGITEAHLVAVADNFNFDTEISTDGGTTYEDLSINNRTVLSNPGAQGANINIKVTIQASNCEIDSIGVLYK